MKTLAPTHVAPDPLQIDPFTQRRFDEDGRPVSLPSDAFVGRETITHGEWLRRHIATYGPGAA